MTEFTDRLLLLLVAATALVAIGFGWTWGLVHPQAAGSEQYLLAGGVAIGLVGVLAAVWVAFDRIDARRD